MPFSVADSDLFGNILPATTIVLKPGPTYVVYPDKFDNVVRTSKDGSIIIQTPSKDSRTRKWIWRNYKTSVPQYNQLFQTLLNFHYKLRIGQTPAKSPWVYVQDTESLNLENRTFSGGIWTETDAFWRVKVVQVTQNIAPQSGYPTYSETIFEFYVDDPNYSNF
jgi:hypothetical protein